MFLQSFQIPVNSGYYDLIPNSNIAVQQHDGFGNPFAKTATHEHSKSHGGLFISQYYTQRVITLGGVVLGDDVTAYAAARRALANALSFNNKEKLMLITTDEGLELQFSANTNSDLIMTAEVGRLNASDFQISLICSDPVIYSQALYSAQGGVAILTGGTAIPTAIPASLAGGLTGALSCLNNGTANAYPETVKIIGPGTDFTISNKTTGEDFQYNGDTLGVNDYVIFDFKNRTATKNGTTNVYQYCNDTWWQLQQGSNTITLAVGSGNTTATQLIISWRDAYWSI